jgi:hypothetical protein
MKQGLCSLPHMLSSCGLPLPPTCLLLTVNEARSYFVSTILHTLYSLLDCERAAGVLKNVCPVTCLYIRILSLWPSPVRNVVCTQVRLLTVSERREEIKDYLNDTKHDYRRTSSMTGFPTLQSSRDGVPEWTIHWRISRGGQNWPMRSPNLTPLIGLHEKRSVLPQSKQKTGTTSRKLRSCKLHDCPWCSKVKSSRISHTASLSP